MSQNARTVNNMGKWTPYETLEEYDSYGDEEKCFMDYVAIAVLKEVKKTGYKFSTSLENVAYMVESDFTEFYDAEETKESINKIVDLISDNGLESYDFNYC